MAVISVRLNSEEEKILEFLSTYYEEEKSTIIKHSLKDLFEDIQDRERIDEFEKSEKETVFLFVEEMLKEQEASNILFNLTYLAVTILAEQGSRQPKRRLNQRQVDPAGVGEFWTGLIDHDTVSHGVHR